MLSPSDAPTLVAVPVVSPSQSAAPLSRRVLVASCAACLVVGYLVASVPGFDPVNPFHPKHDRPVARFLARVAKFGLWLTVFAEPPPRSVEHVYSARHDSMVCHAEGW
jgi:hypothetical protein